VRQGSQTPAVYCLLGNLYSYVGLNLLAEARYLKVVDLLKATSDPEGLAAVHAGLAKVYTVMGDRPSTTRELNLARTPYETLGESEQVRQLGATLAKLADKVSPQYGGGGLLLTPVLLTPYSLPRTPHPH
jgi:hypothetical protein